ncbi:MAG: hypothetical protein FWC11_03500 [Firmicutes bacterium]|nr:hypothetical protein [Bacillota bacterium]MCL2255906.1 hypothetical protein [Bacillota bacterium]
MKKRLLTIILVLILVFATMSFLTGCDDENEQETYHQIEWSGDNVTAMVNNETVTSHQQLQVGSIIIFSWTAPPENFRMKISINETDEYHERSVTTLIHTVFQNATLTFSIVGLSTTTPSDYDCDHCNDNGCTDCDPLYHYDCRVCRDSGAHCRECCDVQNCVTCNEARVNFLINGARQGITVWGFYDENGNSLPTNRILNTGGNTTVQVGDTVTLRWTQDLVYFSTTLRIGGVIVLSTNDNGEVVSIDPRVVRNGNNWKFTFEIQPHHATNALTIIKALSAL